MICDNDTVITNPKDIINEEKIYYKRLYTSNKNNKQNTIYTGKCFLENQKIPRLSTNDRNYCDMILEKKDYALALANLPKLARY